MSPVHIRVNYNIRTFSEQLRVTIYNTHKISWVQLIKITFPKYIFFPIRRNIFIGYSCGYNWQAVCIAVRIGLIWTRIRQSGGLM